MELGATVKFAKKIISLGVLLSQFGYSALAQKWPKPRPDSVSVVVTSAFSTDGALHWAITNRNDVEVYVYDFFLWGPALSVDRSQEKTTFNTTPVVEQPSCPPNRVAPVLLLVVAPGRTISGELQDDHLKHLAGKAVSLTIAVGSDPYTVVDEAKRFFDSDCKHSPYDAIVRWGIIIESKTAKVQ
jgi:hypothetical protein